MKKTVEEYLNKVIQGDCLDVMENFPDKSIDMILCDLPYGTKDRDCITLTALKAAA